MPQQPTDWKTINPQPNDWKPVSPPSQASISAPVQDTSWWDTASSYVPEPVKSGWKWLWDPITDLPSRAVSKVAEPMMQFGESGNEWYRKPALYGGGFLQSFGDVASGLTSPGNLATAIATEGTSLAGKAALPKVAQAMATGAKVGGGLAATQGGLQMLNPESSMLERGMGAINLVGGSLAAKTKSPISRYENPWMDRVKNPKLHPPESIQEFPAIEPPAPVAPANVAPASTAPAEVFDPATLGFEGNAPTPEIEFIRPKTGEMVSRADAQPGDIPLPPEAAAQAPIQPQQVPTRRATKKISGMSIPPISGKELPVKPPSVELTPKASKTPEVTGEAIPPEANDVVKSLSDRLNKALTDPSTVDQATEVHNIINEANQALKHLPPEERQGAIRQVLAANKALLTAWDLSAPGRQGKAFILNKAWWTSLDDMVKAWKSEGAAKIINQSIVDHPSGYFKPGGLAEQVGLDLAKHEEVFPSTFSKNFSKYSGVGKASRAHTAFLNKLRSDQFVAFMEGAKKAGRDPETNVHIAQQFSDFINSATGRGNLGKLQRNVGLLNDVFFAPKNMAGQIQTWNNVLNLAKYANYDPQLRLQALRSLFAIAGVGTMVGQMAEAAGAKVSNNPTSADFRKIRFGNMRFDPFGGYQQFPVAAMKLITHSSTATTRTGEGKTTDLWAGKYGQKTQKDVAETFFVNRLSPLGSFIWAWMDNREFDGKPFEYKKALYNRVFPIAANDILQVAQEDPALAAITAIPTELGLLGSQTYTGR